MTVRSVTRALSILECFDADRPSLALHQISQRLELAKSTTYRLLSTLVESGYVVQKENSEYCLSFQLLRLGGIVGSSLEITDIARPELVKLSAATNETVEISMLSDSERICVDVIESPSPLKSIVRIGERLPLHRGATGLVFMAALPEQKLTTILDNLPEELVARRELVREQIAQVRRRGYALTSGQRVTGASALAAPVRGMSGQVEYCLTITGPTSRFRGREPEFAAALVRGCNAISSRMGFRPRIANA